MDLITLIATCAPLVAPANMQVNGLRRGEPILPLPIGSATSAEQGLADPPLHLRSGLRRLVSPHLTESDGFPRYPCVTRFPLGGLASFNRWN